MLRGENRRMAELPDFMSFIFPKEEGPTQADCVVMVIGNGKTNKWNKTQFMGAFRNKDVHLCPVGALAQYLFWRWHCSGEGIPNFNGRRAWYNTKLLVGASTQVERELSYGTQLEHTNSIFNAVGVSSTAKTQAMRGCGARAAELHGVAKSQVYLPSFFLSILVLIKSID